ncbi:MAG: glycogen/starch synthase, partial [Myxococcota bacterium]
DRNNLQRVGGPLGVPMGIIGTLWGAVYEGRLPHSDVPVYFIDHEQYFGRDNLYNDAYGQGFLDNDNRFVFLSRAALELCRLLDWMPDVVHCNDWHTAAIPLLLNTHEQHTALGQAASLLTIHNIQHQGQFYSGLMDVLGVGWQHFTHLELEQNDQVNLLKGGLYHATLINAVSPGYAEEIKTPAFGYGLEGVVHDRGSDVSGVLNGIDYDAWNPENDPHTAANYSVDDLSGKALCKAALQEEMGLPIRPDLPLFGLVSRLVDQKGIDVLAGCLDELCNTIDLQIVLLGTGESWAHSFFPEAARRHPTRFACRIAYDNGLAHRIEAGSDFFLMPSRFEPCGLNQLYSLRYGTPPIVHAVGGLRDTVENLNELHNRGTGFVFYTLTPQAIYDTVGWATHVYYNQPETLRGMIQRGMVQRFGWEDAAVQYVQLYTEAVQRRRGVSLTPEYAVGV